VVGRQDAPGSDEVTIERNSMALRMAIWSVAFVFIPVAGNTPR